MTKSVQIAIRVSPDVVALADELVERIAQTSPVRPQRTAVMRAALERGLAEMKAELPDKPSRKRKR